MGFLSDIVDSLSDALNMGQNAIDNVISEFDDYLEAEMGVEKESKEAINALSEFSEVEKATLKQALSTLTELYVTLEEVRKEMVEKLRFHFIEPLEKLSVSLDQRKAELEEAQDARKDLQKAKKKYQKEKEKNEGRPEEKKKPEKVRERKMAFEEAERKYNKEEAEAKLASERYKEEKIKTLKEIMSNIVKVQKEYHQSIIDIINELEKKAGAIKKPAAKEEKPVAAE